MSGGYLANNIVVAVFGMVLSVRFCDITWTRQKRLVMEGSMAGILMFQGVVYFWIDSGIITRIYPLITHFPLAVALCFLSRKRLWPVISVLTAYLCCQIRRWLAMLIVTIFFREPLMQDTSELVLTLPILLVLLQFIAPSVRSVSHHTTFVQCQFGLVPMLYYSFDYLTRIYTNILSEGVLLVAEFMPFVCSIAYLVFVLYISSKERLCSQLEQTQKSLNMQIEQAVHEIEALRESQRKTRAYRHDLRHHLQYLSSCIENGRLAQVQGYIAEICSDIEANKVIPFCENEAVNLIFSSFAVRFESYGIPMEIKAKIPQVIIISENDLCVLLSNALENALHACRKRKEKNLSGRAAVSAFEERGKIFLQITNSCDEDIVFDDEIPVTSNPGHGIGVRSICAIVEKYGGIYDFSVKDGKFILRVSL